MHTRFYQPKGNNLLWSIVVWINSIDSFHIRPIEMHCWCCDNMHTRTQTHTNTTSLRHAPPINLTAQSHSLRLLKRRKTVRRVFRLFNVTNLTQSLDLWPLVIVVKGSREGWRGERWGGSIDMFWQSTVSAEWKALKITWVRYLFSYILICLLSDIFLLPYLYAFNNYILM